MENVEADGALALMSSRFFLSGSEDAATGLAQLLLCHRRANALCSGCRIRAAPNVLKCGIHEMEHVPLRLHSGCCARCLCDATLSSTAKSAWVNWRDTTPSRRLSTRGLVVSHPPTAEQLAELQAAINSTTTDPDSFLSSIRVFYSVLDRNFDSEWSVLNRCVLFPKMHRLTHLMAHYNFPPDWDRAMRLTPDLHALLLSNVREHITTLSATDAQFTRLLDGSDESLPPVPLPLPRLKAIHITAAYRTVGPPTAFSLLALLNAYPTVTSVDIVGTAALHEIGTYDAVVRQLKSFVSSSSGIHALSHDSSDGTTTPAPSCRSQSSPLHTLQLTRSEYLVALPPIWELSRLQDVSLAGACRITDEVLAKSLLGRCSGGGGDDDHVTVPPRLPSLTTLDLSDCRLLTDASCRDVAAKFDRLTTLRLMNCVLISNVGVAALGAALKRLEVLDLRFCNKLTASGCVPVFEGMRPVLRKLHILGIRKLHPSVLSPAFREAVSVS